MCGIAGFCSFKLNFREEAYKWYDILQKMIRIQKHRGPDEDGVFLSRHCGMSHVRLSIIDLNTGQQPMTRQLHGHRATISFNGEIYNMHTLKNELLAEGAVFDSTSDTEVVLIGYL